MDQVVFSSYCDVEDRNGRRKAEFDIVDTLVTVLSPVPATHKRVDIIIESDIDTPEYEHLTISLTPIRALAMVKRLLSALESLRGSGVEIPQLHSSFMDWYVSGTVLTVSDPYTLQYLQDIEDSCVSIDGRALEDVLPPALRS